MKITLYNTESYACFVNYLEARAVSVTYTYRYNVFLILIDKKSKTKTIMMKKNVTEEGLEVQGIVDIVQMIRQPCVLKSSRKHINFAGLPAADQ